MKTSIALIFIVASVANAFSPIGVVVTKSSLATKVPLVTASPLATSSFSGATFLQAKDKKMEEEDSENQLNLMSKIKAAGAAGAVSLFIWELAFWAISIPVAIFGFVQISGSFPDFSNNDDVAKVGAEAFAFANVARLALPVRIGLAVSTTPWVQENIVEAPWAASIFKKDGEEEA